MCLVSKITHRYRVIEYLHGEVCDAQTHKDTHTELEEKYEEEHEEVEGAVTPETRIKSHVIGLHWCLIYVN